MRQLQRLSDFNSPVHHHHHHHPCHHNYHLFSLISIIIFIITITNLIETTMTLPTAEFEAQHVDEPKFVVIKEDVIPDVENTTQKVIRVNPLELPNIRDDPFGNTDSDLYTIKSLMPIHRNYMSSKRMRMRRPRPLFTNDAKDSEIVRQQQQQQQQNPGAGKLQKPKHQQLHKKKKLHFLYNQDALDGRTVSKSMRVHVAPGAYPIYYVVSKTNGRFGKYPIKGFNNERDFKKYLYKNKLDPIELATKLSNE